MAAVGLEDVKYVDNNTKKIVLSFIRIAQQLLPLDNVYYTIPELVIHWVLLYYFIRTAFDKSLCGKKYELSNDDMIIKTTVNQEGSVYLTNIVYSGVHRWSFKLLHVNHYGASMTFGVWKNNHLPKPERSVYESVNKGKCYGWIGTWKKATEGDTGSEHIYGDAKCEQGDTVKMILDLNQYQLSYEVNGKSYGVAFSNIEKVGYRAVVSAYLRDDSVKLLSYERE